MESKIISVDLAKDVFEVALANHRHRIVSRHRRLSRAKFAKLLAHHEPATVLFESCGTAHYWARQAIAAGHQPVILPAPVRQTLPPAQQVRPSTPRRSWKRIAAKGSNPCRGAP